MKTCRHPIAWHKGCLTNHYRSLLQRLSRIRNDLADLDRSLRDAQSTSIQLAKAEKSGKTEVAINSRKFVDRPGSNIEEILKALDDLESTIEILVL